MGKIDNFTVDPSLKGFNVEYDEHWVCVLLTHARAQNRISDRETIEWQIEFQNSKDP